MRSRAGIHAGPRGATASSVSRQGLALRASLGFSRVPLFRAGPGVTTRSPLRPRTARTFRLRTARTAPPRPRRPSPTTCVCRAPGCCDIAVSTVECRARWMRRFRLLDEGCRDSSPLPLRVPQEKTLEEYERELAEKKKALAANNNATAARKVRPPQLELSSPRAAPCPACPARGAARPLGGRPPALRSGLARRRHSAPGWEAAWQATLAAKPDRVSPACALNPLPGGRRRVLQDEHRGQEGPDRGRGAVLEGQEGR